MTANNDDVGLSWYLKIDWGVSQWELGDFFLEFTQVPDTEAEIDECMTRVEEH